MIVATCASLSFMTLDDALARLRAAKPLLDSYGVPSIWPLRMGCTD